MTLSHEQADNGHQAKAQSDPYQNERPVWIAEESFDGEPDQCRRNRRDQCEHKHPRKPSSAHAHA
jgi:hypothetical protein